MDSKKENDYVFNFKLARLMGLYQILDPTTITLCGHNIYHIIMAVFSLYLYFMSLLGPISLYFLMNDVIAFTFYVGTVINYLYSCFKIKIFVNRSKDIWNFIDVTSFDFMSYPHYNRNIFTKWRAICVRTSYMYIILVLFVLLCWSVSPLVFNNAIVKIRNIDGSFDKYQMNVINSFVMLSDETYNKYLVLFYFVELATGVFFIYFTAIFDTLVIMMCLALCCQLEAISSAVQSLGYKYPIDNNNSDAMYVSKLGKSCDTYNNLKTIITDHQSVMKKIIDFYDVIWSVTFVQMIVASSSTVLIWFIAAVSFEEIKISESVLSIKLFFILPLFTFQLLMTCYLFGIINEKKDLVIFALYKSNWIDMDLKSKKIILNAMIINNANQLQLKFTSTNIVNLEMFSHTMRLCYTMCSILTKYKNKKN